ncbi:type II toxin-antitoxin system HigA family antitoxin [Flammeovirga sp. SJP92]|uniref:helix-turn-helix domain-containing protein n=1 Tax=Flammeovirga sp. SJP92 TaxID=1775430 RepID=UPI000786B1B4|nr:transcriptional regulator [Flammeovirga sp. SJP92]KXX72757.1 hypothetical protein AVL50_32165 [Flammeovirga sp. SJP92]
MKDQQHFEYKKITNDQDYQYYSHVFSLLMDNENRNNDDDNKFDVLSILLQEYQNRVIEPELELMMDEMTPIDWIEGAMDNLDLKQKDLIGIIGSNKGRVSEVMNGKRPLSASMIIKTSQVLNIPLERLIGKDMKQKNANKFYELA